MPRPKLPNNQKKENFVISLTPEAKKMAEYVRVERNASISELVETYIRREYRKLAKSGIAPEEQIPGQESLLDGNVTIIPEVQR